MKRFERTLAGRLAGPSGTTCIAVVTLLVAVLAFVPALSRAHDRLTTGHVPFSFGKNIERPHEKVAPARPAIVAEAPRPANAPAHTLEPLEAAPGDVAQTAPAPLRAPPAL